MLKRKRESGKVVKFLMINAGDRFAPGEDWFDSLKLLDAQGAVDIRNAIVVAQFGVLQPVDGIVTALIAELSRHRGNLWIICNDCAAFAGSNLFVGIKREDSHVSVRSNLLAFVFRSDGFAGIFDDLELMALRNLGNRD